METLALFRKKGAARRLLQYLLQLETGDWFLEVRESNTAARRLYESTGFREVGRRRAYYSHPVEDALVLKFHSC